MNRAQYIRQTLLWTCIKLTHWNRVAHICTRKLSNIGSDNGLSPDRHRAIIWTFGCLVGNRGRTVVQCIKQWRTAVPARALSRTNYLNAYFWTNAAILLIGPFGTNFSETLIEIYRFSFKKMQLKMSSAKWRPCLGLDVLMMNTRKSYRFSGIIQCFQSHIHTGRWWRWL